MNIMQQYPQMHRDHLADVTRRYARFSRSAAGLASVIGGALALVTYFVGALVPPAGGAGRVASAHRAVRVDRGKGAAPTPLLPGDGTCGRDPNGGRFMTTPLEFIVGVFLVAQAALMLGGSSYALWEQPQVPVAAVALMAVGIRQHVEFRRLTAVLERSGRSR